MFFVRRRFHSFPLLHSKTIRWRVVFRIGFGKVAVQCLRIIKKVLCLWPWCIRHAINSFMSRFFFSLFTVLSAAYEILFTQITYSPYTLAYFYKFTYGATTDCDGRLNYSIALLFRWLLDLYRECVRHLNYPHFSISWTHYSARNGQFVQMSF